MAKQQVLAQSSCRPTMHKILDLAVEKEFSDVAKKTRCSAWWDPSRFRPKSRV